jgi:NAD(P)-dependent dehydrogenase (short-subunit alcohol dehydrogenase family)
MPNDGAVILTGAASGIGRAAAEALAKKSRPLALVDVNAEELNQVVDLRRKNSPGTTGFTGDVSNEASVTRTCQEIHERFGTPRVLVNCAGIGRFAPFLEIEPESGCGCSMSTSWVQCCSHGQYFQT